MFTLFKPQKFYEIGVRGFSTIPKHLRIRQEKNDYNCMVASTATAFNVKHNSKLYDLPKMKLEFDKTLLVGDSNGSGYDNRNFKYVSQNLRLKRLKKRLKGTDLFFDLFFQKINPPPYFPAFFCLSRQITKPQGLI